MLILSICLPCSLISQDTVQLGTVRCGMAGDATREPELSMNPYKNRYAFPKTKDFDNSVTLETMIGDGKNDLNKFSNNKAVSIEGYVIDIHSSPPSKSGKGETCNCHVTDPRYTDAHIAIALGPDTDYKTDKSKIVVVEITPRIREIMAKKGEDWSTATLKKTLLHKKVRFEGWLFADLGHKSQALNTNPIGKSIYRATIWEIHPVTNYEILEDDEAEYSAFLAGIDTADSSGPHSNAPLWLDSTRHQFENGCCCKNHPENCKKESSSSEFTPVLLTAIFGLLGAIVLAIINSFIQWRSEKKKENRVKTAELISALSVYIDYMISTSWFPKKEREYRKDECIRKLVELKSDVVKASSLLSAYNYSNYIKFEKIVTQSIEFDTDLSDLLVLPSQQQETVEKTDVKQGPKGQGDNEDGNNPTSNEKLEEEYNSLNEQLRNLLKKLHVMVADVMK